MAHSHLVGQWAAMEVTSAWLISVPTKSQPFSYQHETNRCAVFNQACLLSLSHLLKESWKTKNQTKGNWKTRMGRQWNKATCTDPGRRPSGYQWLEIGIGRDNLTFSPSSILSFLPLATRGHVGARCLLRSLKILGFHQTWEAEGGWGQSELETELKKETQVIHRAAK